jgi:hypothetical protein
MRVEPFVVEVPPSTLDDLRERLVHTRWPNAVPEEGWERGTNLGYLRSLVEDIRAFFRSRRSTSGAADAVGSSIER